MLIDSTVGVLDRELRSLIAQLQAYPDDATVWKELPGITNTAGTLVLHLAGNLRHFTGAMLNASGYVRDRDAEFARRGASREEMIAELEQTRQDVKAALASLDSAQLEQPVPQPIAGVSPTIGDLLVHLVSHLAYHLGQVDYHRRIATGDNRPVPAISPKELPSA